MPKKKKVKNVMVKPITNHDMIQINIAKSLDDDKKIRPEKVFEGYKQSNNKQSKNKQSKKKYNNKK
jgi:hypothetical protein